MRYSDDFNEGNNGLPIAYMAVGGFLFVLAIFAIVLYVNREPKRSPKVTPSSVEVSSTEVSSTEMSGTELSSTEDATTETTNKETPLISGSKLKSEDLDFWDMYPEETEEESESATEEKVDISKDGKHTLIVGSDGKEEWVTINPYLKRNDYDYTGLVYQYPVMKYFENSEKISHFGVDVSNSNEFVDFNKLKKAGIEFVMIRLGARGYGSGQLSVDEYFFDNMKGAFDAGIKVGVYFYSQAVTIEEALEEAQTVITNLEEYNITYPVAFDMELVAGDTARIETLTREEKTNIAVAFCNAIKEAGFKPMIYGSKEWFIKKLDLSKLSDYDIWLEQEQDVPDYPYRFGMWQYSKKAKIDGIAGNANLNVSFIDYSAK